MKLVSIILSLLLFIQTTTAQNFPTQDGGQVATSFHSLDNESPYVELERRAKNQHYYVDKDGSYFIKKVLDPQTKKRMMVREDLPFSQSDYDHFESIGDHGVDENGRLYRMELSEATGLSRRPKSRKVFLDQEIRKKEAEQQMTAKERKKKKANKADDSSKPDAAVYKNGQLEKPNKIPDYAKMYGQGYI